MIIECVLTANIHEMTVAGRAVRIQGGLADQFQPDQIVLRPPRLFFDNALQGLREKRGVAAMIRDGDAAAIRVQIAAMARAGAAPAPEETVGNQGTDDLAGGQGTDP